MMMAALVRTNPLKWRVKEMEMKQCASMKLLSVVWSLYLDSIGRALSRYISITHLSNLILPYIFINETYLLCIMIRRRARTKLFNSGFKLFITELFITELFITVYN